MLAGGDDLGGGRETLALGEGWSRQWTARWRFEGGPVVCPVRDLAAMPVHGARPVRRFSWRTSQHHRPGLQFMVSTGRHHGFESHAEQRVLLALDFAGDVVEVLAQPFRLAFSTIDGLGEHIPDFLAVTRSGSWLIDVRPGGRIKAEDRVRFAAAAEVALSCGWRYAVAADWRPHVQTTLDTISSQRRSLSDPLGLQTALLAVVRDGPVPFGALVEQIKVPAMARAQALHLIWTRRLGINLAIPLNDQSLVHTGRGGDR
ncbi:TnsA-like heteromeric transposase endonuclease subunit [Nonomuraea cypriaca]|uniref:TnsA-like heteromeric transposase endonuclease subunit n=1 Tax=Nonomuraea cypriaca TaxID=1187855 RepID=UPI001A9C3C66|nr:TnsA-like heteromeric transposase endonuclease subunit [Nonomuraea cypriaca]